MKFVTKQLQYLYTQRVDSEKCMLVSFVSILLAKRLPKVANFTH